MSEPGDAAADEREPGGPDGDADEAPGAHLDALPDGSGCAEIWAHLSERRDRSGSVRRDRDR